MKKPGELSMKRIAICMLLGAFLMATMPPATSQEESAPIVSLMIDVYTPSSPNYDQVRSAEVNLHEMYSEIKKRGGTATIFLTEDVTSSRIRLILAQYTVLSNFEFAVSGKHSDDQLSTMSLSDQEALIGRSIRVANAARVCGLSSVEVLGFMPPGFDQNQDTYVAIDNLGIQYDAGFQAGIIYEPGHETDVWPYRVEGHNFSAVPISTASVGGELVPLYDRAMNDSGISSSEWQNILAAKLDESAANSEPMVVLISTSISGKGEYLTALKGFLNYAVSKDTIFVNARDLVEISTTGNLTLPEGRLYECPACGQDEGKGITITPEEPEPMTSINGTIDEDLTEATEETAT